MADEEIIIRISNVVDDSQVIELQNLLEYIQGNTNLDIATSVDRNQVDELDEKIQEVDGSEVGIEAEADTSQAQGEIDELKSNAEEPVTQEVGADTSEAQGEVDSLKENIEGDTPEMPVGANTDPADEEIQKEKEKADNTEGEMKITADTSAVEDALTALAGSKVAEFGWDVLERAGSVQDSWNRLNLTFKDTGINVDSLRPKIKELTEATGKSGTAVREWFNNMGVVGITNTSLLSDMFKNMAGRAYQTGTTIENLEASIQRMALSGNAGARMLTRMGISSYQLAEAMGVTNEEYVKVFKSMSVEERLQALNKAMGDGTEANEMYKKSWEGLQERASIAFGALLVQIGKPVLEIITPMVEEGVKVVKKLADFYQDIPGPIQKIVGVILATSVVIAVVASTLGMFSTIIVTMGNSMNQLINVVSGLPKIGVLFEKFGASVTKVFGTSKTVATEGAAASAAGAEMEAASLSLSGIASGAASMLAPLLEIAVVIAVMIPVVTALVAEALIFIKLIQILISALDFGGIDLSSAIKGLKQLGSALWEMMIVMGEIIVVSALAYLYVIIRTLNVFTMIIDPIALTVVVIKKAIKETNKLSGLKVDNSIPGNLKNLSESLHAISEALGSLSEVLLTGFSLNILTLGGILGDLNTALSQAVDELKHAIREINSMDFDDIDESKIEKLGKVAESLKKLSEGLRALSEIQWVENWDMFWIPGDTIEALKSGKDDLVNASIALQQFDGIVEVPSGIADKIKSVADALKNMNTALGSLNDIDWTVTMAGWFNPWKKLQIALDTAVKEITNTMIKISALNDIPSPSGDVAGKLKTIVDVLKNINTTLGSLNDVDWTVTTAGWFNPKKNLQVALKTAIDDIKAVANQMMVFEGIQISEDTPNKIKKISEIAKNVQEALKTFNDVDAIDVNFDNVIETFKNTRTSIQKITAEIQALEGIGEIPEEVVNTINDVKTSVTNIVDVIKSLNEVNSTEIDYDGIVQVIENSKQSIQEISKKISELSDLTAIDTSIVDNLKSLQETVTSITTIIDSFDKVKDKEVDFTSIKTVIEQSLGTIQEIAKKLQEELKDLEIDSGIAEKVKTVADTVESIVIVIDSFNNIQSENIDFTTLKTTMQNAVKAIIDLANELKPLGEVEINEGLGDIVNTINKVSQNIINGLNVMNTLITSDIDFSNIQVTLSSAKDVLIKVAGYLSEISKLEVSEEAGEKIKTINSASKEIITALNSMNTLQAEQINYEGIKTSFSSGKDAIVAINTALSEFNTIENVINEDGVAKINNIATASKNTISALNTISGIQTVEISDYNALSTTFSNASTAINSIGSSLNDLGIGEYSNLEGTNTLLSSLQSLIPHLMGVISSLTTFPQEKINVEVISQAVTDIGTIVEKLNELANLQLTDSSTLLSTISSELDAIKSTLNSASGSFQEPGINIGKSIVNGVKSGLSGLGGVIRSKLTEATNASLGTAQQSGNTMGRNFSNGFKSGLSLGVVMRSEMEHVKQSITNGISQAMTVIKNGAAQIVQAFKNGINAGSPGDIYRAMRAEMGYTNQAIIEGYKPLTLSAEKLGAGIVDSFSKNNSLGMLYSSSNSDMGAGGSDSPTINIYVDGDINDDKTMDKLVDKLTRALTWSNATGNRSV